MKIIKKIVIVIALIIMLPILFVNLVILINSYRKPNEVPDFFGWKPFIVLTGSMETEINVGDIVVTKETEVSNLKTGDIIAYKKNNLVTTHRIVQIETDENEKLVFTTKGDNNNIEDDQKVYESEIEGLYKFKITGIGNVAMFIQTPMGIIACLSIPIALIIIIQIMESKRNISYMKRKSIEQKNMKEEIEKLKRQNEELSKKKDITND